MLASPRLFDVLRVALFAVAVRRGKPPRPRWSVERLGRGHFVAARGSNAGLHGKRDFYHSTNCASNARGVGYPNSHPEMRRIAAGRIRTYARYRTWA